MRLLYLFFLAFLAPPVHSATQQILQYRAGISPEPPLVATPAAACAQAVAYRNSPVGCAHGTTNNSCNYSYNLGSIREFSESGGICLINSVDKVTGRTYQGQADIGYASSLSCPPRTTPLPGGMCTDVDTCSAKTGQSEVVNLTSGWKRTPDVADSGEDWVVTYRLPPGGTASLCGGAAICEQTIDATEPCPECRAYVSQVPGANGLYRVSTDFRGHFTGKSCTASSSSDLPLEALHKDDNKDPPCPGYVGEVNGTRGCFGTAAKPVRTVPPPSKPSGISGTDAGNPAAGSKPSGGEGAGTGGSGRTPSAGTGGSAGGPAGAAAGSTGGTKPDGTTGKPGEGKEQAACGAPGQPKCQIDESGTPNGSDSNGKLLDAVNKAADDQKAAIENASKLKADGWTFTFALPSGCSALALTAYQIPGQGALSLDVCKWQPMIHDIMSMVWLICTVWGCVNMVGAAQRGS